ARLIHSIKALKDALQITTGNTDSGVADDDVHPLIVTESALDRHLASGPVELHRVVKQVHQYLLQAKAVAHHNALFTLPSDQSHLASGSVILHGVQRGFDHVQHGNALLWDGRRIGI